ncbi:hypothetical protein [Clostridium sardiniense]|uniref:hypothetical protein n=1 Tax=Clostridium sardiniense TaxID=29369 RepID=UPI001957103D|nr:hypothetical protein [Clostridium sardiniense]MBM7836499.1 hypothetical protein [Clostridium sardiniense]
MIINKNIFFRFEELIDNGTLYIYNYQTEEIIKSNELTYHILIFIEKNFKYADIIQNLNLIYEDVPIFELRTSVNQILDYLIETKIIS